MAKHPKQKSGGARQAGGKRTEPYPKKARVEVTYEGEQPAKSSPADVPAKASKPIPAESSSGNAKQAASASAASKNKGKGKAVSQAPQLAAAPAEPEQATSGSTFIVVAGSYEKLLYGLEGSYAPGADRPTVKPIFIFPAHLACVKAVAASPGGKWLATGSEDEFVKVWDLRRRKEVGSLSQHTGSITSLHFPTSSHLITTSEDSTLSLFRTSDWALLKSLKGHSGRVNHVDVHPTGRVALSVGKDKTLKMWDLMRGRGAASLPLGTEAEMVKFSPQGTHFAVLYPKKIEIYSLTLKLLHTLTGSARFNAILFSQLPGDEDEEKELLCVGTEKGAVEVYTVELAQAQEGEEDEDEDAGEEAEAEKSGAIVTKIGSFIGHTNRVKAISVLPYATPSSPSHPARRVVLLSSVSSDGFIRLFDLTALVSAAESGASTEAEAVASYDTKGSRLTVCYIADGRKISGLTASAMIPQVGSMEEVDDVDESESEEEDGEDMYDIGSEDEEEEEEEEGGMEVEIEDEDEDEFEDEGEYESG